MPVNPTTPTPSGKSMGKPMNIWMVISGVLAVALIIAIAAITKGGNADFKPVTGQQAGETLISFVNEIYAAQIGTSTLKSVSEKNGLYEIIVSVDNAGQLVDQTVFVSKDGKLFIPQALDMVTVTEQYRTFQQTNTQPAMPTTDGVPAPTTPVIPDEEQAAQ